ncbi:MAG: transcription-repair coupling factor (superfamily II helicase) [Woeseiaceae bacterium]|jgi:transcription-repair coupling factor (superfamily II helicase)|tara:strand:+ start:30681 stop:34112 length:3432 start_codon:yes stop_codon:yes gene_type:complete
MINFPIISANKVKDLNSIGRAIGPSNTLNLYQIATSKANPVIILAENSQHAEQLKDELIFFNKDDCSIELFPEWETLPYDSFSPHQDIISNRLTILSNQTRSKQRIIILTVSSLLNRLPPCKYINSHSLFLDVGNNLEHQDLIDKLAHNGYRKVSQVEDHGEYASRGSLLDVFPMGTIKPIRVEVYDCEIESLRYFNVDSQLSEGEIQSVTILPAKEIPLDEASIKYFRHCYRERFDGAPTQSQVYNDITNAIAHAGIEYYLPLFYKKTANFFDYFNENITVFAPSNTEEILNTFWEDIQNRYKLYSHNIEKPLLKPTEAFIDIETIKEILKNKNVTTYSQVSVEDNKHSINLQTKLPPPIKIKTHHKEPSAELTKFLNNYKGKILFTADSAGHRELIYDYLNNLQLSIKRVENWSEFCNLSFNYAVTVAPFHESVLIENANIAIITEHQIFGDKPKQRHHKYNNRDPETIIKQLTDLSVGAPVVHIVYGIGRFQGLIKLKYSDDIEEFLHLEYAEGDKLYVPVHALDLISRYTGSSPEHAPLHRLGSDQWSKAKKRAINKIHDVAAELLDVYARRAAKKGHAFRWSENEYRAFESGFPYETTVDQENAITDVLKDLSSDKPMDRVICGDVGFGKTEVALRAAFAVALGGKQVAVMVPTTLLAQQHAQTFQNRFADWPIKIAVLSRFQSKKEIQNSIAEIQSGKIDIVIGTHKILQHTKDFYQLGLVIIDEEHRFGVRHKEAIKNLRSDIDILTLTATPIPRTLNMTLGGIRELSLITTPPDNRLAVKTFITEWRDLNIREACMREVKRGGQIYFIHNRVEDIENIKQRLEKLMPEVSIKIGHGQMPERQLEEVMHDFYQRRFNMLLCTTIVESGLDIPTANTIIINRADKFGLAQLHQLRGRVGRSHHRAFAYLLSPPKNTITADANKRLEAISSLKDLGSGFTLATHDLEIRGAGELLGDVQSGQIQEIGFSLYTDMLARAVESMKKGDKVNLDEPFNSGVDINLRVPCLLPDDYVPDVHLRLILYKRIASANNEDLIKIKIELIDRFGLLPKEAISLLRMNSIKQNCNAIGIQKVNLDTEGGYIQFSECSVIKPEKLIEIIIDKNIYRMRGPQRLTFKTNLTTSDERFKFLEMLLDRLTN